MADTLLSFSIDDYLSSTPAGSLDRAMLNNLQGINFLRTPSALPMTKDLSPLVFFVRPQLNMQRENIRNVRQLSMLLNANPRSIQTYIRALLDPRLVVGARYKTGELPPTPCPIIDNQQAFIPFLTNNLTSMSPWPSITVPTFTSKPGLYNESYFMADGRVLNSEVWDLNVNVRNVHGDPALLAMYVWCLYMSLVFEGKMVPYLDFITENELDYCTRAYSIVLRPDRRTISKIAATHVSIPTGVSIGESFGVGGDQVYSEANRELSLTFKSSGVDYFDPILIYEFNKTVEIFNPSMENGRRQSEMVKIPWRHAALFNNLPKVYPYISSQDKTLDWWAPVELFNAMAGEILRNTPEQAYNGPNN